MLTRLLSILALASALVFSAVGAASAAVQGSIADPNGSNTFAVSFKNTGPEDILKISLDSSAVANPFVWTKAFVDSDFPPSVTGKNTSTLLMSWDPGAFSSGLLFEAMLQTSRSVTVSDLVGVIVRVVFGDQSVFVGKFVSNQDGSGLLLTAIPLPTALPLLASGLLGLMFLARRRQRKILLAA